MIEAIINAVCIKYDITREQLSTKQTRRQTQLLVEAKQLACYLMWRYRCGGGREIAALVGYPGKQNVNSAKRQIKKISEGNHAFRQELEAIEKSLLRD